MDCLQEVTVWEGDCQPNHVYFMQGDKAFAYSKWGKDVPFYFSKPMTIDKRGRKFVKVKNTFGFKEPVAENPRWEVAGSKGDKYIVELVDNVYNCTCSGFRFRGQCKHIAEVSK